MASAFFRPEFAVELKPLAVAGHAVIEVRGELDSGSCDELIETFKDAVTTRAARQITLDLRQLTFVDSAGTRALIMLERSANEQGISLEVEPPPEAVTELLRTAGLLDRVAFNSRTAASVRLGGAIERREFELGREPQSPARARAEVRECLAGHDQAQLANIVLLTSELVTNAVVHPRGVGLTPIYLRIIVYEASVRVEVEDAGQGFDRVAPPVQSDAERGRGLLLVDNFASRWGTEHVEQDDTPRFRVWFELERQGSQAAATG